MVLSLTYYFRDDTRKIDLQELISEHSIWSKVGWWDSALLESIYEETKVKIKKAEVTLSIWDIKGAGIKKIETGEEMTFQNISFSQLTYYLHNMLLFKLNPGIVEEFAKKYIRLLGCNDKMADTLLGMCCKER